MRIILIGGGETIQTVYHLARHFADQGDHLTIVNPHADEAEMLSQRVQATVILGDGSDPVVLEQAGARRADILLSLTSHDPDNLVACQIAHRLYGVPRTMALVNDPDNEGVFRDLGITMVFSATEIISAQIQAHTASADIACLSSVGQSRFHVTEVILREGAPSVGKPLSSLDLPKDCLLAGIVRRGEAMVPRGADHLEVGDLVVVVSLPETQSQALAVLNGEG